MSEGPIQGRLAREELHSLLSSTGYRLSKKDCLWPEIEALGLNQRFAVHGLKAEIVAAIFRFYESVPQELADKILGYYFLPPDKMGERQD